MLSYCRLFLILPVVFLFISAGDAAAHIKWFYPYDLSQAPRPIGEVLKAHYIYLFLLSTVCIYVFFWIDRFFYRRKFLTESLGKLIISQNLAFWILRVCTSALFAALFILSFSEGSVYLTPELATQNLLVPWIQLVTAAAVWYRPTAPLGGLGIIVLYAMAIAEYGVFHLLDYLIFPGIAAFFLFSAIPSAMTVRYVALFATTGLTLLWGAIEKWAYPDWTYPLLADQPSLLMGMPPEFFMILAGFIEFNITFILLSSASVFSRLIALVFNMIFISAIFMFGLTDLLGHLLIIAVLVIMAIRGPTSARYFLVLSDKSLWTEAYFMTGLYMLALNVVFLAYYGLYTLLGAH